MSYTTQHQPPADRVIWRSDLQKILGVSSETMRRWMVAGKLPCPDVNLSRRTKGWSISTLRLAGINLSWPAPENTSTPAPAAPATRAPIPDARAAARALLARLEGGTA